MGNYVIYKQMGVFYGTPEENFYTPIRDGNKIVTLDGFENTEQIKEYFKKYFSNCNIIIKC